MKHQHLLLSLRPGIKSPLVCTLQTVSGGLWHGRGRECTKCYCIFKIEVRLSVVVKALSYLLQRSTIDRGQSPGRSLWYIDR